MYYPFYDDVNKTPVLKESTSKTFGELIKETDETIPINEKEKVALAINRFEELIGCKCKVIKSPVNNVIYELKYSKTSGKYSVYKLYNYIIVGVDDKDKLLKANKLPTRSYDIDKLSPKEVVGNAVHFVNTAKNELKKYAIEL